ncbi:MAG: TAT-variant-translocated molybdopterin oxidoreductase [Bacteroidetes bacterium]|nr:TAT-variant-translocated molybdopterin oxidoreductase [Bacteroidota bacterium]MCW5897349.1 TAT-variant-translocated molybdopterin oxidoreductase [Bacteroidota bacterium]
MNETKIFDIEDVRAKLSGKEGREYWRSLDEIAETEEFRQFLEKEFPREASTLPEGYSRRDFLKVMGASLSMAGLTACIQQPEEKIVPYVKAPEILVPGKPLYYATAFVLGGYATGVLAKSHMGRPTGIEGNPDHPASLGAADIFATASLLNLYDPDRSQVVTNKGTISSWDRFVQSARLQLDAQQALKGAGLRILTQNITSPTLGWQIQSILAGFPEARWHQYEPCGLDTVREGTAQLFGEYLFPRYRFDKADIIVSLDADFLGTGPGNVRHARDFANRRRVSGTKPNMNRLYCAESSPTITGGMADHRFRMRASEVEAFARTLAARFGVTGVLPAATSVDEKAIAAVVNDLQKHPGSSIVVAGNHQPAVVHALAHAMNAALGNIGNTVEYTQPVEVQAVNHGESLKSLADDIAKGSVDILLILGGNPVYDAPADLKLGDLFSNVKFSVHLSQCNDETSELCQWHVPESHYLEAWGDARAFDGTATIMQPLILPLYRTKSAHELLDELFGTGRSGEDVVKSYWKMKHVGAAFDMWWRKCLNDGVVDGTAFRPKQVSARNVDWQFAAAAAPGIEVMLRPDPSVYDGRFSNNGWLQELPKQISRLTWENVALMSPNSIQKFGLKNGDIVEVSRNGATVKVPAWTLPGHPDESVTLHLGYGRTKAGRVGDGLGANAFALRTAANPWFGGGAEIRKTGEWRKVASTQDHWSMEGRPIVREATLDDYLAHPEFAKHMAHVPTDKESFYPPFEYDGYAWGMTIDLNACTGCNACMIACQSENNIPVVGKAQVENGREMHWIRVDRYYVGNDLDNPELAVMPVACQHCENAPCEPVCPVAATTHDHEGLNVMTYNRCVGTRYCSNNCPYKVRRYNYFQYSDTETKSLQLMHNPDVTVRNRGVMEKCTYCVQRISAARIEAKKEDRLIRDGEIITACQSACPARAITFGDINDKHSNVSNMKAEPRDYGLLSELNTKPRTSYLAKLRNPNPELHVLRPKATTDHHG